VTSDEYQSCVCSVFIFDYRVNAWSGTTFGVGKSSRHSPQPAYLNLRRRIFDLFVYVFTGMSCTSSGIVHVRTKRTMLLEEMSHEKVKVEGE